MTITATIKTGNTIQVDVTGQLSVAEAINAATRSEAAATSSEGFRNEAEGFKDTASTQAANALTSANNAETAETGAEAARDEVVAKIPFDEFTDGSIPKWNNANQDFENQADWLEDVVAGTNVSIDKTDPRKPVISSSGGGSFGPDNLKTIANFETSWLFADNAGMNVLSWDSFQRADSATLGTADSGQTWSVYQSSGTVGFKILNKKAVLDTAGSFAAVVGYMGPNDLNSKYVKVNVETDANGRESGAAFYTDTNNQIVVGVLQGGVRIFKVVGGVKTDIANINVGGSGRYRAQNITVEATLFRLSDDSSLVLTFNVPEFNESGLIDLSTDYASFPTFAGGLGLESSFSTTKFNSIIVKKVGA